MKEKKYTLEEITIAWKRYNSPLIILPREDGDNVSIDDVINMEGKGDFIHFLITHTKSLSKQTK